MTDCRVYPGESVSAQHRPVVATLRVSQFCHRDPPAPMKTKWWRLKETQIKNDFSIEVAKNWDHLKLISLGEMTGILERAGKMVCGETSGRKMKVKKHGGGQQKYRKQ